MSRLTLLFAVCGASMGRRNRIACGSGGWAMRRRPSRTAEFSRSRTSTQGLRSGPVKLAIDERGLWSNAGGRDVLWGLEQTYRRVDGRELTAASMMASNSVAQAGQDCVLTRQLPADDPVGKREFPPRSITLLTYEEP